MSLPALERSKHPIYQMDSVPDSTVRAVARKLRHYIDVERREDGFDRSGPLNSLGEFTSTRGGTLYYNSLQDKHLQHYFKKPLIRKRLEDLGVVRQGTFEDRHAKSKHNQRSGTPARVSAKCQNSRLVDTAAKILMETSSAHGNYSSFLSEVPPDQQSLTSEFGRSAPTQTTGTRKRKPSNQSSVTSQILTLNSGSLHASGGKREGSGSREETPPYQTDSIDTAEPDTLPQAANSRAGSHPSSSVTVTQSQSLSAFTQNTLHTHFQPRSQTANSQGYPTLTTHPAVEMSAHPPSSSISMPYPPSAFPPSLNPSMAFPPASQHLLTACPPGATGLPTIQQWSQGPPPNCSLAHPVNYEISQSSPVNLDPRKFNVLHSHPDGFTPGEMQAGLHKSRQNVHVESVGVSTATSCDASTQTPVDAETQTEKSALTRVQSGKVKRRKRRTGSKMEECSIIQRTPTEVGSEKCSAELQKLQVKPHGIASEEPQGQRVESHVEKRQGQRAMPHIEELQRQRVASEVETSEEPQRQGVVSEVETSEEPQRQRAVSEVETSEEPQRQRVASEVEMSEEPQRQRVASEVEMSEEPQRQRAVSEVEMSEEPQRQRVVSEVETSEEPQRQGVVSEVETSEEPQRQRAVSEVETSEESRVQRVVSQVEDSEGNSGKQVESHSKITSDIESPTQQEELQDEKSGEPQRQDDTILGSSEHQRQKLESQDVTASVEVSVEQAEEITSEENTAESQKQRVESQDEAESGSAEQLEVHGKITSEENTVEPHRQKVESQDETKSGSAEQLEVHGEITSEENTVEPHRQKVESQDEAESGSAEQLEVHGEIKSEENTVEPHRQKVESQDEAESGSAEQLEVHGEIKSEENTVEPHRQKVESQDEAESGSAEQLEVHGEIKSEENAAEPHRQKVESQDETAPVEVSVKQVEEIMSEGDSVELQRPRVESQDEVTNGSADQLKLHGEIVSEENATGPQKLRVEESRNESTSEAGSVGQAELQDKVASEVVSVELQKENQIYHKMQEGQGKDSNTSLDLTQKEAEDEDSQGNSENDTGHA